ncbi:RidA family protein [Phytoactinopolyspora limicola]|uniref:RidA family protein n=1 Tax=Phytoactinopolyspora limicola TaxID=2715536 RepID=UPI001407DDB4|nr:RidA family protein [Phytoactinopolyspora limicola]
MSSTAQQLAALVSAPPAPVKPGAMIEPVVIDNGVAYISGQVAFDGDAAPLTGQVGAEVSVEQAAGEAAKAVANGLYRLADAAGSLDAVERMLKITVFVNSVAGLTEQPQVANGASKALHDILGDRGRHARSAVGVASLPLGVCVEVEMVAKVRV